MANAKATWLSKEAKKAKVLANQIKRFSRRKAIHDFRVCIKKIRAVVSNIDQPDDFKQFYPALTKLFRKTGMLRDLQIIHSRMATLPSWFHSPVANRLIRAQQKERRNAILNWLQHAEKAEKLMKELQDIIDFKNHAKKAIRKHSILTQNESEWHEVRKQIKTEMYQQDANAKPLAAETKIHKQLDEMQKALGNWHDWEITRKWVETQKPLLPAGEFWLLYQQSSAALQKAANLCRTE
jgi:CHAD domain-containing protein